MKAGALRVKDDLYYPAPDIATRCKYAGLHELLSKHAVMQFDALPGWM